MVDTYKTDDRALLNQILVDGDSVIEKGYHSIRVQGGCLVEDVQHPSGDVFVDHESLLFLLVTKGAWVFPLE